MNNNFSKQVLDVLTPMVLLTIIILLLFRGCDLKKGEIVVDGIIVKEPIINCRAHFSGLLMSDTYISGNYTETYQIDESSEYIGEGEYPRANTAFPKSHHDSFDGIAIDKGTRVIIYSKENFKGEILMDEKGPKIITNLHRLEKEETKLMVIENNQKIFKEPLNTNFPQSTRKMSTSNMFEWSKGSLKVICNE